MIAVYLVGFSYTDSQTPLPAVKADLARVLQFTESTYGCSPVVVSDHNYPGFDKLLVGSSTDSDRIFFYFSGHGSEDGVVLPDRVVEHSAFIGAVLDRIASNPSAQILWIVDCCQSGNFSLPFVLRDGLFADTREYSYCKWDLLCLSASSDIAASTSSSLFTKYLILRLEERRVVDLTDLVNEILGEITPRCPRQCVTVSSSRPRLEFLWPWVVGIQHEISVSSGQIVIDRR